MPAIGDYLVPATAARRASRLRLPIGSVTVADAATLLGVSKQTVRRWCDQHERKSPGEVSLPSTRSSTNGYRVIAIEAIQAFKKQRDAALDAREREIHSTSSESDLHYLPQIIAELQSTVGQAIAEYITDTTFTNLDARANFKDLKQRSKVLQRRAKMLLEDLEKNQRVKPASEAMREQLGLISKRLDELVPVEGNVGT